MIFKGDLSNFRPSNLLAFLSNLEVQGILTVIDRGDVLQIGFKDGAVISAQCKRVDEKILRMLYSRQMIDKAKFSDIRQIQGETNLSVKEILENMKLGDLIQYKSIFEFSVFETVFYFFLMESGRYQFADFIVEPDMADMSFDCRQIVGDISYQVDEWNEILGEIGSLDHIVMIGAPLGSHEHLSQLEKGILELSNRKLPVRDLISMLPASSLRSLKHIQHLVKKDALKIQKPPESIAHQAQAEGPLHLFAEFKKTAYQILFSKDIKFRISALARFCNNFFKRILLFTVKEGKVVQYAAFEKEDPRLPHQSAIGKLSIPLSDDRVFQVVHESNAAFLGKSFVSPLIDTVRNLSGKTFFKDIGADECALIPVHVEKGPAVLFFVQGALSMDPPEPFGYLEILSWFIKSEKERSQSIPPPMDLTKKLTDHKAPEHSGVSESAAGDKAHQGRSRFSMDVIETLPPMSPMVSQMLRVLSDPESSVSELAELVSTDPLLVAQLIKVSNSALYKGFQNVTSLKRALSRLGTKMVRSIVMISATKNLFPTGNAKVTKLGEALWRHSVECGLAARRAAIQIGYHDADSAFTAGVLHDIGKLVILIKYTEGYQRVLKIQAEERCESIVAEKTVLGADHTQIGKLLMNKWNMPESLIEAVQYHHHPEYAAKADVLPFIVGYGNYLSHLHYTETHEEVDTQSLQSNKEAPQEALLSRFLKPLAVSEAGHQVILCALGEEYQNTDLFG